MGQARIDVGAALNRAQRALRASPGPLLLATLAGGLALLLAATPILATLWDQLAETALVGEALGLCLVVGGGVLVSLAMPAAGLWLAGLGLAALRRGELVQGELGRQLGRAGAALVPAFAVATLVDTLTRLGAVLCLAPGLIVACGLAFAQLLVLDKGLGPIAALQASWRITRGARWYVLLLHLLTGAMGVVGLLLAGVGILLAVPLVVLTWVAAYEQAWPWAGPRAGVVPARRWGGHPAPPSGACLRCEGPADPGSHTCAGCGARYHAGCLAGRCLVSGCSETWPVHQDWTVEDRARGPWLQVPARPVPGGSRAVLLVALLLCVAVSERDLVQALVEQLRGALPAAWMAWSATAGLVLVPWAVLLVLLAHEHRVHRGVLVDRHGLLLDFGPHWPGTRWAWRDLAGFELEADGVWVRSRERRWSGVLVAAPEADRPRLVELLEAHKVPRVDA